MLLTTSVVLAVVTARFCEATGTVPSAVVSPPQAGTTSARARVEREKICFILLAFIVVAPSKLCRSVRRHGQPRALAVPGPTPRNQARHHRPRATLACSGQSVPC